MNHAAVMLVLAQAVLTAAVSLQSIQGGVPWFGTLSLVVFGAGAIAVERWPHHERLCRWFCAGAWLGSWGVPASLYLAEPGTYTPQGYWDHYFAGLGWAIATAILPASSRLLEVATRPLWRVLALSAASFCCILWLVPAYLGNHRIACYAGMAVALALLLFSKACFRPRWLVIQAVNTLILLLACLPLANFAAGRWLYREGLAEERPELLRRYCSYNLARTDALGCERWWHYYRTQWAEVERTIFMGDGTGTNYCLRLRPNARAVMLQSSFTINSKGFRGREIPENKGNAYRIVALGESTTFGVTMAPDEKPWPELLEQLIRERLKPGRPVEVINAGIPGINLPDNLRRFPGQILPLKPDMIICYHGFNGFNLLNDAMPSTQGAPAPEFEERPFILLAACEYRLKLMAYRHKLSAAPALPPLTLAQPLETAYGRCYCELAQIARTNGIRLVVGNFSMAVNDKSPQEAVEFFYPMWPAVTAGIRANNAHSELVNQLAQLYPEICLVDTHPHLDGDIEKYLDVIHFDASGDRQMAETFFAGIKPLLEKDL